MKELAINDLWTNSTNTLIKQRVGGETILVVENRGRLYAAKKCKNQYQSLVLSGLPARVKTSGERRDVYRRWKQSHIQLQGQFLTVSPRLCGGLKGVTSRELFQNPEALRTWFGENPTVTELDLTHNQLSPLEVGVLMQVLPETGVTSLVLDNNKIGLDGVKVLAHYLPATKLISLSLRSCDIREDEMAILAPALTLSPLLTNLNLYRNRIGLSGVQHLVQSLPHSGLTELNLHRCQIGVEGIQILLRTLPLTKISVIDLGWNELGDEGAETLAQVLSDPRYSQFLAQLKVCRLQSNEIGFKGAVKLAEALLCSKIEELDLGMNNIGDKGATAIAHVLANAPLLRLFLSWNEIGDEGAQTIFGYLLKSRCAVLDIAGNRLGERGAEGLTKVLPYSSIVELNFGLNEIGDRGVESLSRALPHSQVLQLDLQENGISAAGIQKLVNVLPLCPLQQLFLQRNQLGDGGLRSLGSALPRSSITLLDVRQNGIGKVGAVSFFKSSARSPLVTLHLDGNQIDDEAVEEFAPFLKDPHSQLSVLTLRKNSITSRGLLNFLPALPKSKLSSLELEGNPIDPAQIATLQLQLLVGTEKRKKLFEAVRAGDLNQVERLLRQKVSINAKDELGNTPLHLSIENINLLRVLLRYQPIVFCNNEHKTPIDLAEAAGKDIIVRFLQQMAEVPPEYYCPILGTLLLDPVVAADGHNYEKVAIEKHIAQAGLNRPVNSPVHRGVLAHRNLTANHELRNKVMDFVTLHPELYQQLHLPEEIQQAFAVAMSSQNIKQTLLLLERHKQLLFLPIEGALPIQRACQSSLELLGTVIAAYPESLRPPLTCALCIMAAEGLGRDGVELLFDLLPKKAPLSLRDIWFEAIDASATSLVRVLVEMGAHRQTKDGAGITALERAQQKGNQAVIDLVIEATG